MTAIVAVRYFARLGRAGGADAAPPPARRAGRRQARGAGAAGGAVVARVGRNLRRARRHRRGAVAAARPDADLQRRAPRRPRLAGPAGERLRLPLRPRHLVLLEPPLDAPPRGVRPRPRRPPPVEAADRLGGDELPLDRGADRRGRRAAAGVRYSHPRRRAARRADDHDVERRHQSHGLGDLPASWVAGAFGRTIITASHHHLHHRHYRCNYGLYFRFWDKVCGTDRGWASELLPDRVLEPAE